MTPGALPADDTALAVVPRVVRVAGGLSFLVGAFAAAHVLQLFGVISAVRGAFVVLPYAMAVEAVAALVGGTGLARARSWGPWTAILAAASLWATSSVWFLFALANGLFTLFGFMVPGLAVIAFVLALLARKPCAVASAARKRLEEQGLDLGL
jgi:hypothetical protein